MTAAGAIGIPTEVLVVADRFDHSLSAAVVSEALATGLAASGLPARVTTLDSPDYNAQMLAAYAVVTGVGHLGAESLTGTLLSEVATRARQAGVPCHAVVGSHALDLFELRILDLQLVREATTLSEIEVAAAEIGAAIAVQRARGA